MNKRKNFDLGYIREELERISSFPDTTLKAFVAGGCAMAYYGLKEATKDIDIVVQSERESEKLVNALLKRGYHQLGYDSLEKPYLNMRAQTVLENDDGFRWDVFVKKVAKKLALTSTMERRATIFYNKKKLKLFTLSKEDIFLMKAMTERDLDLEDMSLLAKSGLNYPEILEECQLQSDLSDRVWENDLYQSFEDLKKNYGIKVPISRKLMKMAEEKMAAHEVWLSIKGGATDKEEIIKERGVLKEKDVDLRLNVLTQKKKAQVDNKGKIRLT